MHIREYLCREARHLTDRSPVDLPATKEEWLKQRPEKRKKFLEMMGIFDLPPVAERPPLEVKVVGTLERETYKVEKLYYQSLPRLYVSANLYIPKKLSGPAPAVLYVCGHSPIQKAAAQFQAHGRRFAELGFVVLIIDTIQLGEVKGYHHGCYRYGWFHWYSRGYTPAGVELWNGIRGIDLLCSRPEVDAEKIGVTGISGGGAGSWWVGAGDERARVVAPVCGTGTLASHLAERTVDGHCECMFFINTAGWDLPDVGALIAPRPLLIGSADRDGIYHIDAIRECYRRVRQVYELLGVPANVSLVETPGKHSYHERSRTAILSLFLKHLKGVEVAPEEVGDIDLSPEAEEPYENLEVYVPGPPPDESTSTIHDTFVPLADIPDIADAEALRAHREKVRSQLQATTFAHFPRTPCELEAKVEMEWEDGNARCKRISFASEEGMRLVARLMVPDEAQTPAPTLVFLKNSRPPAGKWGEPLLSGLTPNWARLVVDTRGVGESSWGDELAWHIRRGAAIIGRTIASMRVHDTLRALELARTLPEVEASRLVLMGDEDLAAVALYAALLDAGLKGVVLSKLPATQNAPGSPDGTGSAVEILSCLRFTDLAQVAGMLWPAELVFVEGRPASYGWAENLYAQLGAPGIVRHVKDLSRWRPSC